MKKSLLLIFSFFAFVILFGCEKQDTADRNPRCSMPPDGGSCFAAFKRYYYDKKEKKCKEFIWGGCGEFPFATLEECKACKCR